MTAPDPTAAAILSRILAEPGEDAHRLVYADWLEENGDPARAEFVRVQVELARKYPPEIDDRLHCLKPLRAGLGVAAHGLPKGLPVAVCMSGCAACDEMDSLRRRERDLLTRQSIGLWFAWPGCPAVRAQFTDPGRFGAYRVGPHAFAALFARGFVSAVRCPLADWLHHGPAVVRAHPVETVGITDRRPEDLGYGYVWRFEGIENEPDSLPDCLRHDSHGDDDDTVWVRASAGDCLRSLNVRALAWAKSAPVRSA